MDDVSDLFDQLTGRPAQTVTIASVDAWWRGHRDLPDGRPELRAVLGGFLADRLGYAFASGYVEALRQLLGDESPAVRRALCATEAGGAHPRAIMSTLTAHETSGAWRLSGRKTYVTLGTEARELLVVASTGESADGRKQLRVARIPAQRAGVTVHPRPPTPFVPEIPHAQLELDAVEVAAEELLPGDGYLEVLKPFRTIEDAHVHLAALGWLIRLARQVATPDERIERGLALVAGLLPIASTRRPLSPGVHRALAGSIAATREYLEDLEAAPEWLELDAETRARLARDRPLLSIASKARARRLEVARKPLA